MTAPRENYALTYVRTSCLVSVSYLASSRDHAPFPTCQADEAAIFVFQVFKVLSYRVVGYLIHHFTIIMETETVMKAGS